MKSAEQFIEEHKLHKLVGIYVTNEPLNPKLKYALVLRTANFFTEIKLKKKHAKLLKESYAIKQDSTDHKQI